MRVTNILVVLFSFTLIMGCAAADTRTQAQNSDNDTVPANLFNIENVSLIAAASNDADCSQAYFLAKKSVVDQLPPNASKAAVESALLKQHRLVGVWYKHTGWCGVYNIINIPRSDYRLSQHETFEERIENLPQNFRVNTSTGRNKNNEWFVRVYPCTFCS